MEVVKDKGGRVHIPIRFCEKMKLSKNDEVEVSIQYGTICIKKFHREYLNQYAYIGIVRRLDSLDRICIPKEYWQLLNAENKHLVEIHLEDNEMLIFV